MADAAAASSRISPAPPHSDGGAAAIPSAEQMRDVPAWWAIWVPALVYPLLVAMIPLYRPGYDFMIRKEGGIEFASVAVLLVGVCFGLAMFRYVDRLPKSGWWLKGFYAVALLGMFLFAGEELSWGQHLGLWGHEDVPEAIAALNDQTETNFHNMSNLFDQGPTNLIVLATFFAFVILPIVRKVRGVRMSPDKADYWFWPTHACVFSAIGVLLIPFPKRIVEWIADAEPQYLRHSEVHEFYVGLLMTTYMVSIYLRLKQMPGR